MPKKFRFNPRDENFIHNLETMLERNQLLRVVLKKGEEFTTRQLELYNYTLGEYVFYDLSGQERRLYLAEINYIEEY